MVEFSGEHTHPVTQKVYRFDGTANYAHPDVLWKAKVWDKEDQLRVWDANGKVLDVHIGSHTQNAGAEGACAWIDAHLAAPQPTRDGAH